MALDVKKSGTATAGTAHNPRLIPRQNCSKKSVLSKEQILFSVKETAEVLGVGRRTLYSLIHKGEMCPSHKLGGRRVFRRDELMRWVELDMPTLDSFLVLTNSLKARR